MKEMILRVISSGEMISVKSEKSENGVLNKRILVLQELGGKYENCYVGLGQSGLARVPAGRTGDRDAPIPDAGV